MANRKAFDIKAVLWLFNFWHLSANIYFFSSCLRFGWASTYSWRWVDTCFLYLPRSDDFIVLRCEPIDRSFTGFPLQVIKTYANCTNKFTNHTFFFRSPMWRISFWFSNWQTSQRQWFCCVEIGTSWSPSITLHIILWCPSLSTFHKIFKVLTISFFQHDMVRC